MMIAVPLLNCVLWASKFELVWSDENNHLKPWMFVYFTSGICQIIHYVAELHDCIKDLNYGSKDHLVQQVELTED